MLGKLDDSLWHQLPTTFDHVGTSDPRFFDRYWFCLYDPAGGATVQVTMGAYSNMNVLDAGCVVIRNGRQHNLRLSRALRPTFETAVGPLSIAVDEPMERLVLKMEPSHHPISFDLTWTAELPPEEERQHFERVRGRVTQEYAKYVQSGRADGTLVVDGETLDVSAWWACRDHSWGVRPGTGIAEPVTGDPVTATAAGNLFCWLSFSTPGIAGSVQLAERDTGRTYLTGVLHDRTPDGLISRAVDDVTLSFDLFEGTRRFREATFEAVLEDGETAAIVCEALGPSVAMPGLGYSGWDDGGGLGVYRGEYHEEGETWDVRDAAVVGRDDGSSFVPPHRMQPVRITASTRSGSKDAGNGILTFIANGRLPAYGLA